MKSENKQSILVSRHVTFPLDTMFATEKYRISLIHFSKRYSLCIIYFLVCVSRHWFPVVVKSNMKIQASVSRSLPC